MPGLHSPGAAHDCIYNKNVWAKIGDKDKALLETAGKMTMLETYLGYVKLDIDAYKQMKANPNVEMIQVDKSLVDAVAKVSKEWADKQSTSNEWFKKAYEDQAAFLASIKPVSEFRFARRLALTRPGPAGRMAPPASSRSRGFICPSSN
jgi:TRAP-type mannitol/chloroaromatic compound transport system substrate-binding protein